MEELDLEYIDWCDEVVVLIPEEGNPYLQSSEGVRAEVDYARKNEIKVRFIEIVDNEIVELNSEFL